MAQGNPAARATGRLLEIDLARALAAVAVVALHALGYSLSRDPAGSVAQAIDQSLILSLRFARQAFMFLSGFSLAYAYRSRPIHYAGFLGRRGWRTAVPYLVWSAIYLWLSYRHGLPVPPGTPGEAYVRAVVLGTAFYHLYFIVVSLQWYAVFPPALAWVRRLGRHGRWALAGTAAGLSLALGAWLTAGAPLPPWGAAADIVGRLAAHRDHLLASYLGYYLLGTVAGVEAEAVLRRLRRHLLATLVATVAILSFLLADLAHDGPDAFGRTVDVYRPALFLYGLTVSALLLAASSRIAARGGPLRRGLQHLARHSYAVYLAHPLILFWIEWYGLRGLEHHPAVSVPLTAAGVLVPLVLGRLVALTPLAPLLLGHGRARARPATSARTVPGYRPPAPSGGMAFRQQ